MSLFIRTAFLPCLRVPFSPECPICTDFEDTLDALPSLSALIGESSNTKSESGTSKYGTRTSKGTGGIYGTMPVIKASRLTDILMMFLGFSEGECHFVIDLLEPMRRTQRCLKHQSYYSSEMYKGLDPADLTCPLFNESLSLGPKAKQRDEELPSYDVISLLYLMLLGGDKSEIGANVRLLLCCYDLASKADGCEGGVVEIQHCKTSKAQMDALGLLISVVSDGHSVCSLCQPLSDSLGIGLKGPVPTLVASQRIEALLNPSTALPNEVSVSGKSNTTISRDISYNELYLSGGSSLATLTLTSCTDCCIYTHGPLANLILVDCHRCKVVGPVCQGIFGVCRSTEIEAHFLAHSLLLVESKDVKMSCCVNTIPYSTTRAGDEAPVVGPLLTTCSDIYYIMALCGVYPEPSLAEHGVVLGAFGAAGASGAEAADADGAGRAQGDGRGQRRFCAWQPTACEEAVNPFDRGELQANPVPPTAEQQKHCERRAEMIRANLKALQLVDTPELRVKLQSSFADWLREEGHDKELERLGTADVGGL